MRCKLTIAAISVLVVVVGLGLAQETDEAVPGFSVAISAIGEEAKVGSPIPVKLTMTNTSDHDLHFDVMYVVCPPLINEYVRVRQVQLQLYDSEGKPVPLTVYGVAVQGRSGADRKQGSGKRERGVGCGGSGQPALLKPGESRLEEADLSKEFEIEKPGRYTVRAQRYDQGSKAQVQSANIAVTIKQ